MGVALQVLGGVWVIVSEKGSLWVMMGEKYWVKISMISGGQCSHPLLTSLNLLYFFLLLHFSHGYDMFFFLSSLVLLFFLFRLFPIVVKK